jgi:hypothetical protein
MYSAALADQLNERGHDVSAVVGRPEWRALPDADVFAVAQAEHRAVVTENIADFTSIVDGADQRGEAHFGLVLIDPVKFPRGQRRTIGHLVTELDRLLTQHPGDQATSLRHWL